MPSAIDYPVMSIPPQGQDGFIRFLDCLPDFSRHINPHLPIEQGHKLSKESIEALTRIRNKAPSLTPKQVQLQLEGHILNLYLAMHFLGCDLWLPGSYRSGEQSDDRTFSLVGNFMPKDSSVQAGPSLSVRETDDAETSEIDPELMPRTDGYWIKERHLLMLKFLIQSLGQLLTMSATLKPGNPIYEQHRRMIVDIDHRAVRTLTYVDWVSPFELLVIDTPKHAIWDHNHGHPDEYLSSPEVEAWFNGLVEEEGALSRVSEVLRGLVGSSAIVYGLAY
ncbi:hypothetical protein ST47_g3580 [Ascochyta rabiei]|uniref:Uncharacterized protein n=1 Tax=Didymella rabiei TaxID=5454 RepID=A0A163HFP7_DIDRA|nr:hypothetical protein ST47_g3580 [Ascochyta rabiei]